MKKSSFLILLLTAILLVTSCSTAAYPVPATAAPEATPVETVAPTPEPTATPIPTPEPTREPSSTSFEFAKKYCEIYGDEYTEEFAAAFNHAMWTMPSDYSNIRTDLPRYLYEHPYNMWAEPTLKKNNAFKTNVECIAEYGIDEVIAIMEAAKGFSLVCANRDYTNEDKETLYSNLYYFLPSPTEKTDYVKDYVRSDKSDKISQIGTFITDPSLVYQCADGMYRVRGRAFVKMSTATKAYLKENKVELDIWYWFDMEYNIIADPPTDNSKYSHNNYVVYNWIYISNGWVKADAGMIALAQSQLP